MQFDNEWHEWRGRIGGDIEQHEEELRKLWDFKEALERRVGGIEARVAAILAVGTILSIVVQHYWK